MALRRNAVGRPGFQAGRGAYRLSVHPKGGPLRFPLQLPERGYHEAVAISGSITVARENHPFGALAACEKRKAGLQRGRAALRRRLHVLRKPRSSQGAF